MPNRFSSGKFSIAECDRCGFRYKLTDLKNLVIKTKNVSIKVCPSRWDPDQPQLQLGLYPVNDPQAVREPRPDVSYYTAGPLIGGDGGSRVIQWGWNPVGNSNPLQLPDITNDLSATASIGTVNPISIYVTPPSNFLFGADNGSLANPILDAYGVYMGNPLVGFQLSPDPTVEYYVLTIDGVPFTLHPVGTVGSQVPVTYFFTNVNNQLGVAQLITGFVPGMVFQSYGYSYNTLSLVAYNGDGQPSITLTLSGASAQVPGYEAYDAPTSPTSVWYTTGTPYAPDGINYVVDVLLGWSPPSDMGVNGPVTQYLVNANTSTLVTGTQIILYALNLTIPQNVSIYPMDSAGGDGVPYVFNLVPEYQSTLCNRPSAPQNGWYSVGTPYPDPYNPGQQIVAITLNWSAPAVHPEAVINYGINIAPFESYGATTITTSVPYNGLEVIEYQITALTAAHTGPGPVSDPLTIVVQIT